MSNLFDLTGKVSIVTGGNGGIGMAIAMGLAEHGSDIVIAAPRWRVFWTGGPMECLSQAGKFG